jgi:acetate kinase
MTDNSKAILVLNCGSSSLKYALFDMDGQPIAGGIVERIGEAQSRLNHRRFANGAVESEISRDVPAANHHEAFNHVQAALGDAVRARVAAVGHRVVHGGDKFSGPVRIDNHVRSVIWGLAALAPLHNPPNLVGIELAERAYPHLPQVAVFDTGFHQTMPAHAYRYAVPEDWYRKHRIRRYGFHGTSHEYVAHCAAAHLGRDLSELNLITLHLGNGASAAAIAGGGCVDTSMGFTPLEGLVMGTRSGDLDPAIALHIEHVTGMGWKGLDHTLNHECGLKGMAGVNDMREILRRIEAGDEAAKLALDVYCYRIKKYIGAYYAVLGRVDGIVFTAGVGENVPMVRSNSCAGLEHMGIALDETENAKVANDIAEIQKPGQPVRVLVIRTNEELQIVRQVRMVVG